MFIRLLFPSFLCILMIALELLGAKEAVDYCKLCPKGKQHIRCNNNGSFSKSCPGSAILLPMRDDLKKLIVDTHNRKREQIASGSLKPFPPACRMAPIRWDDELATNSEYNVKKCRMKHDKCATTKAFRFVGQNLALMSFSEIYKMADILQKSMDGWFDQYKNADINKIKKYPKNYTGPAFSHFAVMVMEQNTHIGCAISRFHETVYSKWEKKYNNTVVTYLLSCDYSNEHVEDKPAYTDCKDPASKCKRKHPDYKNLCSMSEAYENNKF